MNNHKANDHILENLVENLKKMYKKFIMIIFVILMGPFLAVGADYESDDFNQIDREVSKIVEVFGSDRVLVVFDIDNTILALNQDLGSDQWFSWQSLLIKNGDFTNAVAKDFGALLKVQEKLYALSGTHLTQKNTSKVIQKLQRQGLAVMALTARGPEYRDSTYRELVKNNVSFKDSGIGANAGFVGKYKPYELASLKESGLSLVEITAWGLGRPREVSYVDGIFMVAGQHKGAMLRTLLYKTKRDFDAIVFVDDKVKNTRNMTEGFEGGAISLVTFRYTREDKNVERFKMESKAKVIEAWRSLNYVLSHVFKQVNGLNLGFWP